MRLPRNSPPSVKEVISTTAAPPLLSHNVKLSIPTGSGAAGVSRPPRRPRGVSHGGHPQRRSAAAGAERRRQRRHSFSSRLYAPRVPRVRDLLVRMCSCHCSGMRSLLQRHDWKHDMSRILTSGGGGDALFLPARVRAVCLASNTYLLVRLAVTLLEGI